MTLPTLFDTPLAIWLTCALIALGIEFMTGTLYLLVISIALAAGGISAALQQNTTIPVLIASLVGLIALFLVFQWKRRHAACSSARQDDADIGQTVQVLSIHPHDPARARVFYRGTQWDARLTGTACQPGQTCTIVSRDGNELTISSSGNS